MTVPLAVERNDYTGDGNTHVYAYSYRITSDAHLLVTVADTDGAETTLTKTTDYTVSGVGVKTGGNVTLVNSAQAWLTAGELKTGYDITVRHVVPLTQLTDVRNQGVYYPETHEDAFDYLMWAIKQQQDEINRCVKLGETSSLVVTLPAPQDGYAIIWDGITGAMKNGPVDVGAITDAVTDAQAAQSAAEAAETNAELAETNAELAQVAAEAAQAAIEAIDPVSGDGTVNPTNLLSNGDFESWSAGTTSVPDGWALELTPTLARDTGDVGYGSYACRVTGNGAALEGIKFTTGTLKPSTKYTFSVRVKATAGDTASIITTGATTNISLESTSATFELKSGTFTTDGSGTAVVIKLLAKADTDIVWFDGAMLVEGESAFAFSPKPAEEGVWAEYSATSTITGWASFTEKSIKIKKIGKIAFVSFFIRGTSNATGASFTLPDTVPSTPYDTQTYIRTADNTSTLGIGFVSLPASTSTPTLFKNLAGDNWTNSGTKTVSGQFFYEIP
jgi:hypothetical protein